ncbi:MAG: hypothetical protein V1824_03090 [archaeon]
MAKNNNTMQKVGSIAFIIGVILAIVLGVLPAASNNALIISILILLGVIVGFLNVNGTESTKFLMAAVSVVIVTSFGGQILANVAGIGTYLEGILNAIMTFVMASTIVVALKTIYELAQD